MQWVEQIKGSDSVRFPLCLCWKLEKRYLRPVQSGAQR